MINLQAGRPSSGSARRAFLDLLADAAEAEILNGLFEPQGPLKPAEGPASSCLQMVDVATQDDTMMSETSSPLSSPPLSPMQDIDFDEVCLFILSDSLHPNTSSNPSIDFISLRTFCRPLSGSPCVYFPGIRMIQEIPFSSQEMIFSSDNMRRSLLVHKGANVRGHYNKNIAALERPCFRRNCICPAPSLRVIRVMICLKKSNSRVALGEAAYIFRVPRLFLLCNATITFLCQFHNATTTSHYSIYK